jgi:hypothetical protein
VSISQADAAVIAGSAYMRLEWSDGRSEEDKAKLQLPNAPSLPPMKLRLKILQVATPHGAQFQLLMWQKGVSEKNPYVQTVELPKEMMEANSPEGLTEWLSDTVNKKAVEMADTLSRGWPYTLIRVS